MPDMAENDPYFESAARNVTDNTKAMLAAIAEGGQAGLEAFKLARSGIEASRAAALGRAGQRATDMGITGVSTEGFTGASDERLAALSSAQAGFTSGLEATKASNESYMGKVSASLPFLVEQNRAKIAGREGEIRRAIEMAQQAAAADAAERQAKEQSALDRENRTEQRSIARENRSAATRSRATSSPAELSDSELKVRLGGAADEEIRIEAARPHKYVQPRPAISSFSRSQIARSLGADAGLDPYQVAGLFPDAKAAAAKPAVTVKNVMSWARTDEKTAKTILGTKDYQGSVTDGYGAMSAGESWKDFEANVRGYYLPGKPRTYAALVAQFKPLFTSAGLAK